MTLLGLEREISKLSPFEKIQVLQTLVADLTNTWLGIEKTPGINGGDACIVRTRIPVWTIENYRRLGWSEAEILENFPTLRAVDLTQVWAYVATHEQEIDQAIREQEEA